MAPVWGLYDNQRITWVCVTIKGLAMAPVWPGSVEQSNCVVKPWWHDFLCPLHNYSMTGPVRFRPVPGGSTVHVDLERTACDLLLVWGVRMGRSQICFWIGRGGHPGLTLQAAWISEFGMMVDTLRYFTAPRVAVCSMVPRGEVRGDSMQTAILANRSGSHATSSVDF